MANNEDEKGIFRKIIDGDIPSERVYEDEHFLAFKDIQPKAPIHFLVVPKAHSSRLDEMLDAQGREEVGALFEAAVKTARSNGVKDYRLGLTSARARGKRCFTRTCIF